MGARLKGWRKLSGASWGSPQDPQFTGDVDIDAAELSAYVASLRKETGEHVTVTHVVGKAVAYAMTCVPELNVRLAHGREYPRESIDVFFIVSTGGGSELSGVKVAGADQKSVVDIARQLGAGAASIDAGTDADFGRAKRLLTILPPSVLRRALGLSAWLTSDMNLDLPALGMRRQSFGGAMITSVGMWGISHAYSPLAHYYRVPVLLLVGAVAPRPVVVAGRVTARPMLTLTATFDHRYVDGYQAARFAHAVQEYLAHPGRFDAAPPGTCGSGSNGVPEMGPSALPQEPVRADR